MAKDPAKLAAERPVGDEAAADMNAGVATADVKKPGPRRSAKMPDCQVSPLPGPACTKAGLSLQETPADRPIKQ